MLHLHCLDLYNDFIYQNTETRKLCGIFPEYEMKAFSPPLPRHFIFATLTFLKFLPPLLTLHPIPALTIYPHPFPTPAHPVSTFNFHIIGTRFVSERHHNTQPLKIIED